MRRFKLSDAVKLHRYKLIVCKRPGAHKDVLGSPQKDADAAVLKGRVIACKGDDWAFAFDVSHEIAEHVCGFDDHSSAMFCEQANILSIWCKHLNQNKMAKGIWYAGPHLKDVKL